MAQRKKKRTSIRTAAGTAQKAFGDRLRALRDDPLRVLPDCPHGEPKPIAKVHAGLEKVAAGKVGFRMRRDKGVVGAVVQSLPLAEKEAFPRLIDHKVGGQRRFFLTRGHVARTCMLGVQNHDDPRTLLMAYRAMAKEHGLHFFAGDRVTCTGELPRPPQDFVDRLADKAGITLAPDGEDGDWTCPHREAPRVRLGFRGGPSLLVCASCGKTAGNLHGRLRTRYAGPRERHPVEVDVVIAGQRLEPEADRLAAYRGGVEDEKRLIEPVERAWRDRAASGVRFVLGGRDFGDDQAAFLDAIGADGWMRDALAAMTRTGHAGQSDRLGSVLTEHAADVEAGVRVFLGDDAPAFVAARPGLSPDALLRQAHDEAEGRARLADLPDLAGLGPVGTALDDWARTVRRDGRAAGLDRVRRSVRDLPAPHRYAMLAALGGDPSQEHGFDADARAAGGRLADDARGLLEASGEDYRRALRAYLERAGVGETA